MMNKRFRLTCFFAAFIMVLLHLTATAQYLVDFNQNYSGFEKNNLKGWSTVTGDGDIVFRQKFEEGSVVLNIDARKDKRNIWYAFMHQSISDVIDLKKLLSPDYELRMEARVKPSHAPRRINMYLSSLNAGGYLREFDLEKANEWYTISMVTSGYDFNPDKPLMTQISLMDWGNEIYELCIDYIKVDLVKIGEEYEQFGLPLIYRPPVKDASYYSEEIIPDKNAIIDASFADESLHPWLDENVIDKFPVLQIDQSKTILLKWDFSKYKGKQIAEAGQLEITTNSIYRRKDSPKDFGELRFSEILSAADEWNEETVTYNGFTGNKKFHEVIVSQCIIDSKVNYEKNGKTIVTISKPVLQRLIDGKSAGIAILPLGLISATFYDRNTTDFAPRLRFNIK